MDAGAATAAAADDAAAAPDVPVFGSPSVCFCARLPNPPPNPVAAPEDPLEADLSLLSAAASFLRKSKRPPPTVGAAAAAADAPEKPENAEKAPGPS